MNFNVGNRKFDLPSIRFVYRTLQVLGFFPIDVHLSGWKSHLHVFFKWFHISLCIFISVFHCLSTILHSVHHLPEFFSCLIEDVTIIGVLIIVILFRYRMDRVASIIHFMETCFSTVDASVMAESRRKALTTVIMFVALFLSVVAGILAEWLTPMTEDELKLREELHGTKRQARRLLVNMWIPGLDETESWTYEVLCLAQIFKDISIGVFLTMIANYFNISIVLYQLVTIKSGHQSKVKLFKILSELTVTLIQFYSYCNTMEIWDDCHARMRTSLYLSRWYTCSSFMRRDMCVLLSRLRKPSHPRFCQGFIVLCNPLFVRLLRVCYQAVKLVQLTGGSSG
ncbi:hypothetical protein WDU94_000635 [Cyamophila willieti]